MGEDYLPPQNNYTNAISKSSGESYIVGIDCNIPLMRKPMELATSTPNIIAFDYQVSTIEKYCWGDVHTISIDEVEWVFRLTRKREINKREPFKTKSGNYVDVNIKSLKV